MLPLLLAPWTLLLPLLPHVQPHVRPHHRPLPSIAASASRRPAAAPKQRKQSSTNKLRRPKQRSAAAQHGSTAPKQRGRGSTGRGRGARPPSFATRLQQARLPEEGLALLADARDAASTAAALQRLALLCPRASSDAAAADALRRDPRLKSAITKLTQATDRQRCTALWALGMCCDAPLPPPAPLHRAAAALVVSIGSGEEADGGRSVPAHEAAQAVWGCDVLGLPAPPPLAARALGVPFRLHVGVAAEALLGAGGGGGAAHAAAAPHAARAAAVAALARELPLRRDEIASGSASPSQVRALRHRRQNPHHLHRATSTTTTRQRHHRQSGSPPTPFTASASPPLPPPRQERVLEDRGTCWLSDGGHAFECAARPHSHGPPPPPPALHQPVAPTPPALEAGTRARGWRRPAR